MQSLPTLHPNLAEVKAIAGDYDKIPLSFELIADFLTPMQIMRKLKESSKHSFLLESVEGGEKWARYSFLGANPDKILHVKNGNCKLYSQGECTHFQMDSLSAVRKLAFSGRVKRFDNLPPFTGGGVGYFGYETIRYVENMNLSSKDVTDLDDCIMMFFDSVIVFDHLRQKLIIIINLSTQGDIDKAYTNARHKAQEIIALINSDEPPTQEKSYKKSIPTSNFTKEQYMQAVRSAKEYIRNGDIFQVVPSQRFTAKLQGSLWNTYRVLRTINPSPYMYYLKLDNIEIAGASPETLVRVKDGEAVTFPIAGTRKRGKTPDEDIALERELLNDPKEIAEHNMLVDLARNDIGKIAKIGSVQLSDYMKVNRYSHVMHITSQVSGKLRKGIDSIDALASVLPAGTLSGAPKIRAMEIIDELEGEQRGVYGGALGYVGYEGNLDTCITIRTVVKKDDTIYMQAGGGAVLDSDPESEYEETINKLKAIFKAVEQGASL